MYGLLSNMEEVTKLSGAASACGTHFRAFSPCLLPPNVGKSTVVSQRVLILAIQLGVDQLSTFCRKWFILHRTARPTLDLGQSPYRHYETWQTIYGLSIHLS
ncbi:hypothetical protein TNCV_4629891 [Trichonephila clavipes]|nr:hypothetical protein TNCV_4629891 [Trichonephila clavipes]